MNPQMTAKVPEDTKWFMTISTFKWFQMLVGFQMIEPRIWLTKWFITRFTSVMLFTMSFQMTDEVTLFLKRFLAVLTLDRVHSCMYLDRFHSCMYLSMEKESCHSSKWSGTLFTVILLITCSRGPSLNMSMWRCCSSLLCMVWLHCDSWNLAAAHLGIPAGKYNALYGHEGWFMCRCKRFSTCSA